MARMAQVVRREFEKKFGPSSRWSPKTRRDFDKACRDLERQTIQAFKPIGDLTGKRIVI